MKTKNADLATAQADVVAEKKERKDRADLHIEKAVKLMKPEIELDKLFMSHRQLEQTFHEASGDLRAEKISQESFRTFNEAYKTSREFIERTIEEQQRKLSAQYIKQVMDLLEKKESADMLLRELDGILMQAKQLLQENIFSRESFRTFVESYNVVRDSLKAHEFFFKKFFYHCLTKKSMSEQHSHGSGIDGRLVIESI